MFDRILMNPPGQLLAGGNRVSDVASQFHRSTQQQNDWVTLCLLVGVPIVIAVSIAGIYHWHSRPRREYCKPTKIFSDLCRLHKVKGWEQQQLLQMATRVEIDQPALLFTTPSLFENAMGMAEEAHKERIGLLKQKLFG